MYVNNLQFYSKNFIKSCFNKTSIQDWRINIIKELLKFFDGDLIIDDFDISDLKDVLFYLCTY